MFNHLHKHKHILLNMSSLSHWYLLIGDLEELQDHSMSPHVPQKPLLLFFALPTRETFLDTEPAETKQDLIWKSKIERRNRLSLCYLYAIHADPELSQLPL